LAVDAEIVGKAALAGDETGVFLAQYRPADAAFGDGLHLRSVAPI